MSEHEWIVCVCVSMVVTADRWVTLLSGARHFLGGSLANSDLETLCSPQASVETDPSLLAIPAEVQMPSI